MSPESFLAEGGRLDAVVAAHLGMPRAEVQRAIADGAVVVDGRRRPKSFRLTGGERVEVARRGPAVLAPDHAALAILYEDPHLLVVSKPAGVVAHPTPSRAPGRPAHRSLGAGVPLAPAGGPDRPGIGHRLDVGTSGAMLVAKDDATYQALADQFRRHDVERTYLALVRGRVGTEAAL